jgi:hypothetical protein
MPKRNHVIHLDGQSIIKLDLICEKSGYTRSEQVEAMIALDFETISKQTSRQYRCEECGEIIVDDFCVLHPASTIISVQEDS